ncbi:MAG: SpoIIE family protein phosphatase [Chloroflexi bacterium]|nr:SpoIIE family protein phosphatase [Chloroflexota bacterium]
MASHPESTSLLQSLLERSAEAVGAHHGMALVADEAREMVVCRGVYRLPAQGADSLFYKIGQGNTGRVAATGQAVRLNHTSASTPSGRGAVLIVPVNVAGEAIAVLNLNGAAAPDGFSADDERRVTALADEMAPQILRALLTERQHGAVEGFELSQLVAASLLKDIQDSCSQLLGVPCVFVDPRGRCLAPISSAADFCVLMRSNPVSALRCELSMARAGVQAMDAGGTSSCECHAGVMTTLAPVTVRETYVGGLVAMLRYEQRDSVAVRTMAMELKLEPWETLARASLFPSVNPDRDRTIRLYIGVAARLTGALAEERLAARMEQARVGHRLADIAELRKLTQQLTGVLDLDVILNEVTRRAVSLAHVNGASISLLEPDGRLRIRSQIGLSSEVRELLAPAISDSPDCRVVTTGAPVAVADITSESAFPAWTHALRRQPALRSAASFFLGVRGKPLGALTLYSESGEPLSHEASDLLGALADHGSLAIQSARATQQALSNEQALRLFLSRMTRGLSSSLDSGELVKWIADFAVEMSAAAHCVVYEQVGHELQVRATSRASRTVIERPILAVGDGLSGHVAEARKMLEVADIRKDPRFLTSSASLPADSSHYVGVPLLYKTECLGVMAVYSGRTSYTEDQLQLLNSFAGQAAIAIQNARSYEHQKEIANIMQETFLPQEPLRDPGLEVGRVFDPALEAVGGDYYDFVPVGGGMAGVVLGDVSGKGIRAATYTAMGKYVLRAYAHEDSGPSRTLERVNSLLASQMDPGTFITLFYGLIDLSQMKLRYGSAGHPDGLLYRSATEEFIHLTSTGMMVGAVPGEVYDEATVDLRQQDILVLYTDGVLEARRENELFGMARLKGVIARNAGRPAPDIAKAIHAAVKEYHTEGMGDDICILALRFLGKQGPLSTSGNR